MLSSTFTTAEQLSSMIEIQIVHWAKIILIFSKMTNINGHQFQVKRSTIIEERFLESGSRVQEFNNGILRLLLQLTRISANRQRNGFSYLDSLGPMTLEISRCNIMFNFDVQCIFITLSQQKSRVI